LASLNEPANSGKGATWTGPPGDAGRYLNLPGSWPASAVSWGLRIVPLVQLFSEVVMRRHVFAAVTIALSGIVHSALVAPTLAATLKVDCAKAVTTPELNLCADRTLQAADTKLNSAYKKVLAEIRKSDNAKPYDPVSWEKALRASQKAWIAYRDADCAGLLPMSWTGGTGTTSAVLGCKAEKTELRTKELLAILDGK
jgi:uncharacterized protein YecT (DUF1311 family)